MISECNTLFGLDSGWWIFIATMLLVGVTWKLWRSQQKDNKRTRELFELLNKPLVYCSKVLFQEDDVSKGGQFRFIIKNGGKSSAEIIVTMAGAHFNKDALLEMNWLSDRMTIYPGEEAIKIVALDKKARVRVANGEELFFCLKLQYNGLHSELYKYVFLGSYKLELNDFIVSVDETKIENA